MFLAVVVSSMAEEKGYHLGYISGTDYYVDDNITGWATQEPTKSVRTSVTPPFAVSTLNGSGIKVMSAVFTDNDDAGCSKSDTLVYKCDIFPNLERMNADLIWQNNDLPVMNGLFPVLSYKGKYTIIDSNALLLSLGSAFEALEYVGGVFYSGDEWDSTPDDWDTYIDAVILSIEGNPQLTDAGTSFSRLRGIRGKARICDNHPNLEANLASSFSNVQCAGGCAECPAGAESQCPDILDALPHCTAESLFVSSTAVTKGVDLTNTTAPKEEKSALLWPIGLSFGIFSAVWIAFSCIL